MQAYKGTKMTITSSHFFTSTFLEPLSPVKTRCMKEKRKIVANYIELRQHKGHMITFAYGVEHELGLWRGQMHWPLSGWYKVGSRSVAC